MEISTTVPVSMWDQRFSQKEYVYGTEPNEFLRISTALIQSGDVLCLADGEGRNGVYLAQQGNRVTSVDVSSAGLKKARRLANQRGVTIRTITADLEEYEIGHNRWDAIVSIFCHLPMELRRTVHKRVIDGLRPGGLFLLEAYTPDQIGLKTGGPKSTGLLMTLECLRSELSGLEFEHAAELKRDIHEGILHNGVSAVVQLIARKPG